MREQEILEARLRQVDKRRAEIDQKLPTLIDGSNAKDELMNELVDLARVRNVTDLRLKELRDPQPNDPEADRQRLRRQRMIDAEIKIQIEMTEAFAAKLEAAGDHSQARIQRMSMLDIPAQIAREFGQ